MASLCCCRPIAPPPIQLPPGHFPSYRSQAVQYGEPAGLPLADQPARHLPAFPVSQPAALPSASAEPSPVLYSRASQCQSCSGPSQQHACQRLCSDYASARHVGTARTPASAMHSPAAGHIKCIMTYTTCMQGDLVLTKLLLQASVMPC